MFSRSIVAAFLAVLPAVSAVGSAIVKNQCDTTVYLWSDYDDNAHEMQTIPPGGTYSESYVTPSNGGGVSIKMSHRTDLYSEETRISQFEYTLAGNIWYDISNINGNPFWFHGMSLTPSDASCPAKVCPAGVEQCQAAYNQPDDNQATAACSAEADTTFILCSGAGVARREAEPANSTVETREAEPEAQPALADSLHDSMRKRAAHRHHFHRRSADMQ